MMTLSRVLRKAGSNFHGCPWRPLSNNRNKYQFLLSTAVSPSGVSIAARAPSQKQRIVHNIPNQSSMCEVAINAANVRRAEDDQATVEIIKTHEHVQNPNIIWKLLRHVQLFDPGLRQGKRKTNVVMMFFMPHYTRCFRTLCSLCGATKDFSTL